MTLAADRFVTRRPRHGASVHALVTFAASACALLATVAPVRAEITAEAAAVLRRYVEVTGGAAAAAAESTTYSHARIEGFGFTGSYSAWTARPFRRYAITTLGPFKLLEG